MIGITYFYPAKKLDGKNIREKLLSELNKFKGDITDYFEALDNDETEEIPEIEKHIRRHLNNNSEYASFKRCIIKNNRRLNNIFGHYIPVLEREEQHA